MLLVVQQLLIELSQRPAERPPYVRLSLSPCMCVWACIYMWRNIKRATRLSPATAAPAVASYLARGESLLEWDSLIRRELALFQLPAPGCETCRQLGRLEVYIYERLARTVGAREVGSSQATICNDCRESAKFGMCKFEHFVWVPFWFGEERVCVGLCLPIKRIFHLRFNLAGKRVAEWEDAFPCFEKEMSNAWNQIILNVCPVSSLIYRHDILYKCCFSIR
jgi:hypothetical protein